MGRPILDYNSMTNEELLQLFKQQYEKIKPSDAMEYMKKCNIPSLYILKTKLGLNWNDALLKIGIEENNIRFYRRTKDDYIQDIRELFEQLGKVPSSKELIKYKNISVSNLKKVFNLTYNELLNEIGLEPNQKMTSVKETDEELLKMYKEFCNKLGRVATVQDLNNSNEIYNANIFMIRFGGFNNLRKLAGYREYERAKKRYSKQKILGILKEEYIKIGRRLTVDEINIIEELPKQETILSYFETTKINEVWEEVEQEMIKDYIKLVKNNHDK